ncbi:MAG: HAD family hydrolase, partial [bacterium]|nr:HAD family hydrolase [bacterium]
GAPPHDTLWHCESLFRLTHQRFVDLLSEHGDQDRIESQLAVTEKRNLRLYGYGAKGFTLSMIETALDLTDGAVDTRVIREILAVGREMLTEPIEPLPGVEHALAQLSQRYRLILITKGD